MSARASKGMGFVIQVFRIRWLVSLLAVVIAFAIGAVFIVLADASVVDAYYAMFRGSIVDLNAPNAVRMFKPLTDSLFYSIPLIISGLGLALGFRAGLFNIGGKGQIIVGALAAVWVGRGRPLRRHRGCSESKDGRERGDRDDHAQLDRDAGLGIHPHAEGVAGARNESAGDSQGRGECGARASASRPLQAARWVPGCPPRPRRLLVAD